MTRLMQYPRTANAWGGSGQEPGAGGGVLGVKASVSVKRLWSSTMEWMYS